VSKTNPQFAGNENGNGNRNYSHHENLLIRKIMVQPAGTHFDCT